MGYLYVDYNCMIFFLLRAAVLNFLVFEKHIFIIRICMSQYFHSASTVTFFNRKAGHRITEMRYRRPGHAR